MVKPSVDDDRCLDPACLIATSTRSCGLWYYKVTLQTIVVAKTALSCYDCSGNADTFILGKSNRASMHGNDRAI